MKINLTLPEEIDGKSFIKHYIIPKLIDYIKLNLNEDKQKYLNQYLKNKLNLNLSSLQLLEYAIKNFIVTKSGNDYIIMLNKNISLPKSRNQNLSSIIKLIEYGSLEIKGTNILYKAFSYIKDNLDSLIEIYEKYY